MTAKLITMASVAALALAGCSQKTTTVDTANDTMVANDTAMGSSGNGGAAIAPTPSGGQAFANAAAASDAFEIASSQLALTTSTSKSVKAFAQKMIDAHTASTAKLKAAATAASPAITPDPALNPAQQTKLDGLKTATGKAFDDAYVAAQTEGHQQTLDTLRAYATSGDVPVLKTFAETLAPTVAAHLNMAKSLKP